MEYPKAKVSIVIPLYNKAPYVERAVRSVLNQTFSDFELIVIDDGSEDGGDRIVEAIKDPRIRLIRQENAGPGDARNHGIELAQGQFIAFLDADDLWLPGKLQDQTNFMLKHPEVELSATNYTRHPDVADKPKWRLPPEQRWWICSSIFTAYVKGFRPCTPTVMVTTAAIRDAGGFPTDVRSGEDVYTWFKVGVKTRVAFGRDVHVHIYPDPVSVTRTSGFDTHDGELLYARLKSLALGTGNKADYNAWRKMLFYYSTLNYIKRVIRAGEFSSGKKLLQSQRRSLGWFRYILLMVMLFMGLLLRRVITQFHK